MTLDIICEQKDAEEIAGFFTGRGIAVDVPPAPLEAGGSAKNGTVRLQIKADAVVRIAKIIFEFLQTRSGVTIRYKSSTVEMRIPKGSSIAEIEAAIIVNTSKEFEFKIVG
jgi:hypothetical protein